MLTAETKRKFVREFYLQWHITNECDMRCSHCYIPNNKKEDLSKNLSLKECIKVIESFKAMSETLHFSGRIHFSGGNPLLREDFFEIARYAKEKGFKIGILGNPISLIDETMINKLKELKISSYQISIDGLEETHDKIRGRGTFRTALLGLEKLVNAKIRSVVMATITKENLLEIPELTKICAGLGVNLFSFARIVYAGEGEKLKGNMILPDEYKNFLETMYRARQEIRLKHPHFRIGTRDPLWALFFYESGLLDVTKSNGQIVSGCSIGINSLCLDVDGIVYGCRRLEIPIGNVNEQSLESIFLKSKTINEQRNVDNIKVCGSCEVMPYCRGCRAVAYSISGDYFGKDPQCWKK